MNKDIKLLIENIFQREDARELLKKSKAEEIDAQIRKMYLYHPKTKKELIDNVIECLENKTDLNLIDVSEITDFKGLFSIKLIGSKIGSYIKDNEITSIDISGWYIRSDAILTRMFQNSTLEEIVLPNNLHKIEDGMFHRSNLTSVTIPNSVTSIGNYAFMECFILTSVDIPNSVTSIGDNAFDCCDGLTSVTIPDSVTKIGYGAFDETPNLTIYVNSVAKFKSKFNSISIPIKSIKEKPINENIFQRKNARELLKRNKAEELDAQIRKMYLYHPTTKEELRENISECIENDINLNLIDVSNIYDFSNLFNTRSYMSSSFTSFNTDNIKIDISGWYINPNADVTRMFNNHNIKEIILPSSIQKISKYMFENSSVETINIPASVKEIDIDAFHGCRALKNIKVDDNNKTYNSRMNCNAIIHTETNTLIRGGQNTIIPMSVTNIGSKAFDGCRDLINIIIPGSIKNIAPDAFLGCDKLKYMYLKSYNPPIYKKANENKYINPQIIVPVEALTAYREKFVWSELNSVGFDVDTGLFYNIDNKNNTLFVTTVNTTILDLSYEYNTEVKIPSYITIGGVKYSVTTIKGYAFANQPNIKSIYIPSTVTTIEQYAFYDCRQLTTIYVDNVNEFKRNFPKLKRYKIVKS